VNRVNKLSALTAAAKSNWPGAAPGLETVPFGAGTLLVGRAAVGIGGLPGCLATGFTATGGGPGFGLLATGGGFTANELEGRELLGVVPAEPFTPGFFHGAEDEFGGKTPGKTATGLAETSVTIDFDEVATFGVDVAVGAAGEEGGGRRAGGGGAAGGALGF